MVCKIFSKRFLFTISLAVGLLNINTYSYAKVKIVPLKGDVKLLNELQEYKVHQELCDKHLDRYVAIKDIEYYNFEGELKKDGVIVVQDVVAENVVKIFEALKLKKFPVANINPKMGRKMIDGFFGKSVEMNEEYADNFTGAYSCRGIAYTNNLSMHALGVAIDLNLLQNPCIFIDEEKQEIKSVIPKAGVMYLNRKTERPNKPYGYGKIDDNIIKIFQKYGFDVWGGNWDNPIDYQHFQVSNRKFSTLLIEMDKNDAKNLFNKHTLCFNSNKKSLIDFAEEKGLSLRDAYYNDKTKDKKEFFKLVDRLCHFNKANRKR